MEKYVDRFENNLCDKYHTEGIQTNLVNLGARERRGVDHFNASTYECPSSCTKVETILCVCGLSSDWATRRWIVQSPPR